MKILLCLAIGMFGMAGLAKAEGNDAERQDMPADEISTDLDTGEDNDMGEDNDTREELDLRRYVVGGALGTVFGFGIGHAVQGRYRSDHGWLYTAGELSSLVVMGAGFAKAAKCSEEEDFDDPYDRCLRTSGLIALTGYLLFTGLKITEIITVWLPSADRYIITEAKAETKPHELRVLPVFNTKSLGLALVTSL